jgi:CheY-like chemotaxis protein
MTQADTVILVAEDNEVEREGLAAVLRRQGYAPALAADGRQALAYLRSWPAPALVLLDMLMPGLDGWRFLEEFRRLPAAARPPVLVVTANPAIGREWAEDHGCAGVIRKPIDLDALLFTVQTFLSRAG